MRAFKKSESTKNYIENFRTYYNFLREHQTLKTTPAQKAGLNVKPEWKELVTKSLK